MDSELSNLAEIRTDRVSRAVPKNGRRSGNRQQFESQLRQEKKDGEEADRPPDPETRPPADAPAGHGTRPSRRGKLLDYKA